MIGIFLVGLVVAAILIGAFYFLYQILTNFQPSSNKISGDLQKMRAEIQPWINELVPWSKEEMELLSHNQVNKAIKKGVAPTVKGIVTSIFNEPMMTYSFKKYVSPGKNGVLLVRTSHHEFVFRIRPKGVEVTIDKQVVGTIRDEKDFFHVKNNQLIASIQREEGELLLPVLVGNKEVGSLSLPDNNTKAHTRAFQLLSPMSSEEEAIFLSLAAYELIKPELPKF